MEYPTPTKPVFFVKDCGSAFADVKNKENEVSSLTTALTPEESKSKYAKYYKLGEAELSPEVKLAFAPGNAINPMDAFLPTEYGSVMNIPGNRKVERGYCVMPEGYGFVTMKIVQDGVTDEIMENFNKNYNPEGDLFYKTWLPGTHLRHYSDVALEDFGWGNGLLGVEFFQPITPSELGISGAINEKDPNCFAIVAFNQYVYTLEENSPKTKMIEIMYCRDTPSGRELFVTFWLGLNLINGKIVNGLQPGEKIPEHMPRLLCEHCAREFYTVTRNIRLFWEDCNNGYF